MMTRVALEYLLDVPSMDPDDARRRKLLNILLAGAGVLVAVAVSATFAFSSTLL